MHTPSSPAREGATEFNFENHQLTRLERDYWLMTDGPRVGGLGYEWFELRAVCQGTHLLLVGDLDLVCFGHYTPEQTRDHRFTHSLVPHLDQLVRWIAKGGPDYVAQKAQIGMTSDALVYEHAVEDVVADLLADESLEKTFREAVADGTPWDSVAELRSALDDCEGAPWDDFDGYGKRITARVRKAHAAIQHVARLIERGGMGL